MIHAKTNPIGLDAVIAEVQAKLMALEALWGVSLDGYPRCYPAVRDGKKVIEHYAGDKEYQDVVYAEGHKFFFIAENDLVQVGNGYFTTDISVFFMLDLAKIKPNVAHRADAETWADVAGLLRTVASLRTAERIVQGFDRVFPGFDYRETDDLQPYHYFRVDLPVKEFELDQIYCEQ